MNGSEEERCKNDETYSDPNIGDQMVGECSSSLPHVGSKRHRRTFDVFISFRGGDTRNNFTSHLSSALYKKQIDVFVDDRLEKGDEISEALVEAIKGSTASLVVFSENYASSKWCLDELVQILECKNTTGQLVIPIFYNVDPSHVRWQKQSFDSAFTKHAERYKDNMDKVNKWRSALREAANLSGHSSSVCKSESELVDEIVRDIVAKLNRVSCMPSQNDELVGIESRVEKVLSLLDIGDPDIRIVGIWGTGGIGKTTLADAVFNRISRDFEGSDFFWNVRDTEERGDLVKKRNEILSVILGEHLHVSTSMLPSFVVNRLRRKRVLVVFDDVNNQRQLEFLFKGLDQCGPGSRVIITTRDRQVLSFFPKDKVKIYHIKRLGYEEAFQLFRRNAVISDHQAEAYDELVWRVVHYASGIPLALKVFARSLKGKDKLKWESVLNKLGRVPNLEIKHILQISYDGLDDEEIKDVFLDIAHFFKGQDVNQVTRILNGCYHSVFDGISVLQDKALATVSSNKIDMPEPLQELGLDIVMQECKSEPGRRTRLCRPEDVHHVLKRNSLRRNGTETVRGMSWDLSKAKEVNISPDTFEKMYNLRILKFYTNKNEDSKVHLPRGLESLPDELRYLCWHGYPLHCLPPAFCPENLIELDMSNSNLTQLWDGTQDLGSLKILNLAHSRKLEELPNLSGAKNLEQISLDGCEELVSIPCISNLPKLVRLKFSDCKKLKNLPSIVTLRSLVCLNLDGCSQIDKFPEISTSLETLSLSGTAIEQVPCSIQNLSRLVFLYLRNCLGLKDLPDSFQSLDSLARLDLYGCRNITKLPRLPGNIMSLNLEKTGIQELPPSIGSLCLLSDLQLSGCKSLKTLPDEIWKLPSLRFLYLSNCSKLEKIPQVLDRNECLEWIDFSGTAIKELPSSVERLVRLHSLFLDDCRNLSLLPDTLWNMERLMKISLHRTAIRRLPPFGTDSSSPPLSGLCSLDKLELMNLRNGDIPKYIGCLTSLRELNLSGNDFKSLPASIKQLSLLERLDISNCRRLESLPELPNGLEILDAHECVSLGTTPSKWEFLVAAGKGTYVFSNCLRLQEEARTEILDAAKLLFQPMARPYVPRRKNMIVCLPGSNIPDWFSACVTRPSMTFQLPTKSWDGNSTGMALCVSVAFSNHVAMWDFWIRCKYRFENGEGDCLEKSTCFHPILRLLAEEFSMGFESRIRRRSLGPEDHVFLCYDESTFSCLARHDDKCVYQTVTVTCQVLNIESKPFEGCRVKNCGYYMSPHSTNGCSKL